MTAEPFDHQLLRRARRAAGLNQADLARQVGVKQASVSDWERGRRSPRPTRIKKIAAVLGIDPAQLVDQSAALKEGLVLRQYRERVGLSQANLAARLQLHPASISNFESGRYWPKPYAAAWARQLGITQREFRAAWERGRDQSAD
ncbi:MAG: helix-turn-helix transcriptional regulator [Desertimonas sp.]